MAKEKAELVADVPLSVLMKEMSWVVVVRRIIAGKDKWHAVCGHGLLVVVGVFGQHNLVHIETVLAHP